MYPDIDELSGIVTQIAKEEALSGFTKIAPQVKRDGSVVTEIDHRMQARIRDRLGARWPEYGFLGEEMSEAEQAQVLQDKGRGFWCLDPLDGTSNFASGLPFFSVSLALVVGGETVIAVVFDPVREECFTAGKGAGASLNGKVLERPAEVELRRCIACVDFKRLPSRLAGQLAQAFPYMSQRNIGSSALDWCWLAVGRFQVYIHGGQKLWDYAAGDLILREAGGCARTLLGEPVMSGQLEPRSVVAAMTPRLCEAWWAWVEANRD
jgi:myo-inositol-1(or 4)-monophosphatase